MNANTTDDVLVLSELYLPVKGGHVEWLHEAFRRIEKVHLLTRKVHGLPDNEVCDGIHVRRIPLGRMAFLRPESLPMYVSFFFHTLWNAVRLRPRAIVAVRAVPEGVIACAVSRLLRIPVVVFAHGEEVNRSLPGQRAKRRRRITNYLKQRMLWGAYRKAKRIIANSHFTASLLAEGGIAPDKVVVVHPGTDPEKFRPMPKDPDLVRQLEIGDGQVLLTLGRLTPRKGHDTIIGVLPTVLKKYPDTIYVIAGCGEYQDSLQKLATDCGVSEHVRFIGKAPDELLSALYNLADIFVMPNRCIATSGDIEGFGIVFLEAGCCEKPVIGGRSGGVPDAIADHESGVLVDGASVDEVAEAIVDLLGNPEQARILGQNGRERVLREFTWDHSATAIRKLIDSLGS